MYERNLHCENLIVQLRQFAALLYTSYRSITKFVNFDKNRSQKMLLPEVTKLAKLLLVLSDCNGTRTQNHLVWLNGWMFVYQLSGCGFEPRCSHLTSNFAPVSSKEFLDIQVTIKCGFTLKRVRDMIKNIQYFLSYLQPTLQVNGHFQRWNVLKRI